MRSSKLKHGYGHDRASRVEQPLEGNFAYHLRRHRQWYGERGISQRTLAMVAHVSRRCVAHLEATPELQASVEAVLRVAIALGQPLESLVSPKQIGEMCQEIDRRKKLLGLPHGAEAAAPRYTLAITYRTPHLLLALSEGGRVLEILKRRLLPAAPAAAKVVRREAARYALTEVVVENRPALIELARAAGLEPRPMRFDDAKAIVSEMAPPPTHHAFFHLLIERHPELARFVRVLPATGRVAVTERWRTARLVVATLAIAAGIVPAAA